MFSLDRNGSDRFVCCFHYNKQTKERVANYSCSNSLTAEAEEEAAANPTHNPILNLNPNLNNLTASVFKLFVVVTDTRIDKRQVLVHKFGIG